MALCRALRYVPSRARDHAAQQMSIHTALELIESVASTSVLFIGDTIIDEYQYVTPLGKSPKENLVPVRYERAERFLGGVDAAAKHAQSFCARVEIQSCAPAVRKTRFVELPYVRKLFEIHHPEPGYIERNSQDPSAFDCVIVADFGHGAVKSTQFPNVKHLCVSAQTNSSNVGFNLITKYGRADYAVIDEPEARLAAADRKAPIEEIIARLARGRFTKMIITHGQHGAYGWHDGRFAKLPAFTDRIVDTMGAGDAFFAITAPMSKSGSIEDLLLIGNAAGALKTQIVGHRSSVTKQALIEFIRAL
jgi:bifunctional ADP-heptose synthase (sugar kinase/adenylyltransferase)